MKKTAVLLLVCGTVLCTAMGCKSGGKTLSGVKASYQDGSSCDEAVKEYFGAMYTRGGGEIFYDYMFPDEAVEAMKTAGKYDKMVSNYNKSQEKSLKKDDAEYSFGKVTSSKELTDEQKDTVRRYFVTVSAPYAALDAEKLEIKEGYELTFDYTKDGKKAAEKTVLAVRLNDEGWKVITQ
ncbi:hypothetical protein [uncultured Ruminococcus sp.]|uniref:hypothetical protein n=1 Tax=uncultured Ruminococcus sp. TaxID=165186 RepID=UPI002629A655|nr:hypothetical protein [uncultured Ruminococcus sp.]